MKSIFLSEHSWRRVLVCGALLWAGWCVLVNGEVLLELRQPHDTSRP